MKFCCTVQKKKGGLWAIRHVGTDVGTVEVEAASREEAAEKMVNELRYRLEMCPCTGEAYRDVKVEIVESSDGAS